MVRNRIGHSNTEKKVKHHGAREISQKNVEDTVWFLLLLTVKCDEKKKNTLKKKLLSKKGTRTGSLENSQVYSNC